MYTLTLRGTDKEKKVKGELNSHLELYFVNAIIRKKQSLNIRKVINVFYLLI